MPNYIDYSNEELITVAKANYIEDYHNGCITDYVRLNKELAKRLERKVTADFKEAVQQAIGFYPTKKIQAIKHLRTLTKCSLREAKDAVEASGNYDTTAISYDYYMGNNE